MKKLAALVALAVISFVVWEEVESRRAWNTFWIDRAKTRRGC